MFGKLIAGETMPATSGTEGLRLELQMQYSVRAGGGTAALRWIDPHQGGAPMQAALVALLYGRTLCIGRETRKELFHRVDSLAKHNVQTEGQTGFEFAPWTLHVGWGGGDHELWPWYFVPPDTLPEAKTYTAILKSGEPCPDAPAGYWLQLVMPRGLERVLIPSAALIAISAFSRTCDREARYLLSLLLWQMNAHWGSPDSVSVGSEAVAFAVAYKSLREAQLRHPT